MELASYCGIHCGACPSYDKGTCFGCKSEDRHQKRISKWNCNIRVCCHGENGFDSCAQCKDLPCDLILKLQRSHQGDDRFVYRAKIVENLERIGKVGLNRWTREQEKNYRCPKCDSTILFYSYECPNCHYKSKPR